MNGWRGDMNRRWCHCNCWLSDIDRRWMDIDHGRWVVENRGLVVASGRVTDIKINRLIEV